METDVKEVIRLNLGANGTRVPGFKNVDLNAGSDVDLVCDVSELKSFSDGSVDEILASNILEHFPHVKTVTVLKEWCRVLKPEGKLHISVPDFDACVQVYLKSGIFGGWLQNYLYGDQYHQYAFHYTTFNYPTIRKLLDDAGFSRVRRVKSLPFGLQDTSEIKDSWFYTRMALNLEIIK